MSTQAISWAWEQTLPPATKLVLLGLAYAVRQSLEGDWRCWPSQQVLAAQCGISDRSIRSHIARLLDLGLIESWSRPGTGEGRQSTIYRLLPPQQALDLCVHNPVDKGGATGSQLPVAGGGATGRKRGATGRKLPPKEKKKSNKERERARMERPSPAKGTSGQAPVTSLNTHQVEDLGRATRPDLSLDTVAASWRAFAAHHQGETRQPSAWLDAWRLWIARERDPRTTPLTPASFAAALIPQAPELTPNDREQARGKVRSILSAIKSTRTEP